MKRLILLFAVLLVLSGCGRREVPISVTTEPTVPQAKELYIPDHPVETLTNGAVRAYSLGGAHYLGIAPMREKLLLVSDKTEFTVLQGARGEKVSTATADTQVSVSDPAFSVSVMGVSYYRQDSHEVVLLNPLLKETARIALPQDVQGSLVVSLINQEIYYCQGQEIRALNISSGISRLVKSLACENMQLAGSYFQGNLLACRFIEQQGRVQTIYLDSQTGQTLSRNKNISYLESFENDYFCIRMDGAVQQKIFGSLDGKMQSLNLDKKTTAVLALGGVITSETSEAGGVRLDFYQLREGKRTASIELPSIEESVQIVADGAYVWILADETGKDTQTLFRWDIGKAPVSDETVYTGPLYTADDPDTQQLAQLKNRAEELGRQHGVKIRIGKDAVEQSGQYVLQQEYQVPAIQKMLGHLEQVLSLFPDGFLKSSMRGGSVNIGLVRNISDHLPYAQFYKNGNAYILLSLDSEIQKDFIRGFAYVVDSHVLGNSRAYDTWGALNPEGFYYDLDYEKNAQRQDKRYTEGENPAFIDRFSMSFPHEERCRIFYYAMTQEGEGRFESDTMQRKLLRMCEGIREAYGLEKNSDTYPWEQYLNQSIAH